MDGAASIAFTGADGTTRLDDLYHRAPLRVLFPTPAPGDVPLAALVTTSGGLVGGDRLAVEARAGAGARAMVAAQAAEKVYRSTGADVDVAITLAAEDGAWLEWLPQETILFNGARLRRRTRVDVSPGGRLLAGEILVFGRTAHGERLTRGLVHDRWEVCRAGRAVWSDSFRMEGDLTVPLAHPAGLDGATAYATAVYVGDDAKDRLADAREGLGGPGVRAAATRVAGVLVIRWLGTNATAVRRSFGMFWAGFRATVAGLPPSLPRLWHV